MKHINLTILPSSGYISDEQAREKAIKLAAIQDDILKLSTNLPDELSFHEDCSFRRHKDYVNFSIDKPLFYQKTIWVNLNHNNDNAQYDEQMSVKEGWELSLNIFSDEQMKEDFKKYADENDKLGFIETQYFLDKEGSYMKLIKIPKAFAVTNKLFCDYGSVRQYYSKMTELDFVYAERALNVLKTGIEDYLQYHR